jgi:signal transduction histidine kinase
MAINAHQKFRSISRGLLISVLATSSLVTSILTAIQIAFEYRSKAEKLESLMNGMQDTLVPSIEGKLWNNDSDSVSAQLKTLLSSIDVSKILLRNGAGAVVFEESLHDFSPAYPQNKHYRLTSSQFEPNERVLGHLEIVFYKDKIVGEIKDKFILILLLNGLHTTAVASILLLIFYRKITRPIREITEYFKSHSEVSRASTTDFIISSRKDYDEISIMIEHIISRETALANWSLDQSKKVKAAETSLSEADQSIRREKLRAETAARLAQLGEMATGIAHEINNPLAIISGYNHFIRSELKHPEPRMDKVMNAIESIEKTILRITKIIVGLRAYARDGSKDPMNVTSVRQIIDDAMAMTESKLRSNGIVIRRSPEQEEGATISCRAVQIVQVIVALINNSVDAIKGQSDMWIEINVKTNGQKVELMVTDSGLGISSAIEKRIFEPFFTTKEVGHGTGLGLSIAYGIIKDHDGEIFVDYSCKNTRFVIHMKQAANVSNESAA